MAGLIEKAAINPVLMLKWGTRDGILCNKRVAGGEPGKFLLSMRTRSPAHIDRATVSIIGKCRRSWRACSGTADSGHEEDVPNQQPETSSSSSYFTGSRGFFNEEESNFFKPPSSSKGWDDYRLLAQLRSLAVIADDRCEMHGAVAIQRDNWGKLLQVTITMSMISAGILSGLNSRATQSFSLSLTAALLSAGSILFMSLENWFQPSQMAEEQRAASRFFKNMVKEIEASLKPGGGSELKQDANLFYETMLEKLRYYDVAFPLPLFPGGLDKFPKDIGPSVLSAPVNLSLPEVNPLSEDFNNGWTPAIVEDLKRTSALLKKHEIAKYIGHEKKAQKINKPLAIAGPALAFIGIVANFAAGSWGAVVAAGCCILAALCSSFSHDAQVGMVFEMYRDVAGTFEDMDKEIQRNLRLPVDQREDGELFHQKIALQLGRKEGEAIVSSDDQKSAGTLL